MLFILILNKKHILSKKPLQNFNINGQLYSSLKISKYFASIKCNLSQFYKIFVTDKEQKSKHVKQLYNIRLKIYSLNSFKIVCN